MSHLDSLKTVLITTTGLLLWYSPAWGFGVKELRPLDSKRWWGCIERSDSGGLRGWLHEKTCCNSAVACADCPRRCRSKSFRTFSPTLGRQINVTFTKTELIGATWLMTGELSECDDMLPAMACLPPAS
jgi:hypothetical protein